MLRKLALATVLAGSTILLGCTTDVGQTPLEPTAASGFAFHFLDEGESAKLAYGQANSDNVGLMLQCAKGSRTVEVSDIVRSRPASTMTLASQGQSAELKTEIQPGPSAAIAVARAPAANPALQGFRRSGQLQVSYAGLKYAMAARPDERASVERFFSMCERAA